MFLTSLNLRMLKIRYHDYQVISTIIDDSYFILLYSYLTLTVINLFCEQYDIFVYINTNLTDETKLMSGIY